MKGQPGADELTLQALNANISPSDILTKGLIVGMEKIGVKFKANQVFVPQVLMSAKAMGTTMKHLKQFLMMEAYNVREIHYWNCGRRFT